MKQNDKSLLTITNQLEELKAIGTLPSVTGSEDPRSLPMHDRLKKATLSGVPRAFKQGVNESIMLLTYDLRHKQKITEGMDKAATFHLDSVLSNIKSMYQKMLPASAKTVGMVLETIASTFNCNVPDELGLTVYIKFLGKYPEFVLTHNTEKILETYKWRRLPLPSEFIDVLEPDYMQHKNWLHNFHKTYLGFAKWKQSQYNTSMKGV